MQTAHKQQGVGLILWLFVVVVIATTAALTIKLAPIYAENYMLKRILDSVREEAESIKSEGNGDFTRATRDFILQRLQVNRIHYVTNNNIAINNAVTNLNVRILYEVRVPIMANIDAILHFDNSVQVPIQ